MLRFFRHFSTTRTYLADNRERERGPIVSVGVDPPDTFWPRLPTFDVYDQITIATWQQALIWLSCELPIRSSNDNSNFQVNFSVIIPSAEVVGTLCVM